jgi:hypothetical protein
MDLAASSAFGKDRGPHCELTSEKGVSNKRAGRARNLQCYVSSLVPQVKLRTFVIFEFKTF